jgi:hypothetical protein
MREHIGRYVFFSSNIPWNSTSDRCCFTLNRMVFLWYCLRVIHMRHLQPMSTALVIEDFLVRSLFDLGVAMTTYCMWL